jgi:hypothetical protein
LCPNCAHPGILSKLHVSGSSSPEIVKQTYTNTHILASLFPFIPEGKKSMQNRSGTNWKLTKTFFLLVAVSQ